jgi:hypothetical protein
VVRALSDPLLELDRFALENRRLDRAASGQEGPPVEITVASPLVGQAETLGGIQAPRFESARLQTEGFFRGQIFACTTPVTLEPVPSIVVTSPEPYRPRLASLAVRADQNVIDQFGQGSGAIAIVLDCSGSMVNPVRSKFDEAKTALETVLQSLPAGTELSIVTFGQAAPGFDKDFPRPDDTQQHDRPELTIQVLRPLSAWDPNDLAGLRAQLDALQPFHGTPLVEAMWRGKLELDKTKGLKTLLVLTDGKDTRLAANREFNTKGLDIPAFIGTYFRNTGILVDMVFFKVVEDELKEAEQQFASAVQHLDLPGRFVTVQTLDKLITALQRAIVRKLVCQLEDAQGTSLGELDVTGPSQADRWWTRGLPAGDYTIRLMANRVVNQSVHLEEGDRLVARVTLRADRTLEFERVVYGDEARHPAEPIGEGGGWQLSVLANQLRADSSGPALDLAISLEELPGSSRTSELLPLPALAGPLSLEKPGFAWFGLAPESSDMLTQLRWHERTTYPASVWLLQAPHWVSNAAGPSPARPRLEAWWLAGALGEKVNASATDGTQVHAEDGTAFTIECVRTEDHWIQNSGGGPLERVHCLVIRVAHPPGKPCLVDTDQMGGQRFERFEHRWYPRSAKYEGLFWPIARGQTNHGLDRLALLPIEPRLRAAESNHSHVELNLGVPRTQDRSPDPPSAVLLP